MPKPSTAGRDRRRSMEARAIEMLERYDCPMPYHAVRTHFLGAMSGTAPVQPMKVLARIWDGTLPAFASIEAVNELLRALINGLWNELTVHQDEKQPYRLMPTPARVTRERLASLAETRAEEIEGFLTGVFGDQENLEVPEPMGAALDTLMELVGIFAGMQALLEDPGKPVSTEGLEGLRAHVVKLTHIAECEIHDVVIGARILREQEGAMKEKAGAGVH
ncbi:MAG: hypothetical protein KGL63_02855 [Betaproteobacteria bacterium]|nr:hypothetical protein [Betaproteobacteria bacterium]